MRPTFPVVAIAFHISTQETQAPTFKRALAVPISSRQLHSVWNHGGFYTFD